MYGLLTAKGCPCQKEKRPSPYADFTPAYVNGFGRVEKRYHPRPFVRRFVVDPVEGAYVPVVFDPSTGQWFY